MTCVGAIGDVMGAVCFLWWLMVVGWSMVSSAGNEPSALGFGLVVRVVGLDRSGWVMRSVLRGGERRHQGIRSVFAVVDQSSTVEVIRIWWVLTTVLKNTTGKMLLSGDGPLLPFASAMLDACVCACDFGALCRCAIKRSVSLGSLSLRPFDICRRCFAAEESVLTGVGRWA